MLCEHCLTDVALDDLLRDRVHEPESHSLWSHLEECPDCRRRLQQRAAGPDLWEEAAACLADTDEKLDSKVGELSFHSQVAPNLTLEALHRVKRWLGPTDDPTKLGRIGKFEVTGVIGAGGAGIVVKAFDPSLNRYVAIKLLHPSHSQSVLARRRFERESRAVAAISHPNVVPIHAIDRHNDEPFISMEYVEGRSLQHRLDEQGPLALDSIVRVSAQIARGLAAAHSQGVIHRDIKPANILLTASGNRVLVTDFGLARVVDELPTHSGGVAGTPQYMSPEQCEARPIDHRSDLFSLGSVIYAMGAGRPPFRADTLVGTLRRVSDSEPDRLREINPEIPAWLEALVARLHQKDAGARFGSASEVAEILERELAHLQSPTTIDTPTRPWLPNDGGKTHDSRFNWSFVMPMSITALIAAVILAVSGKPPKNGEASVTEPAVAQGEATRNAANVRPATTVVGNGVRVERERPIAEFDSLSVADGVAVTIVNGDEPSLRVVAEENLLPHLRTEFTGGTDGKPGSLLVDFHREGDFVGTDIRPTLPTQVHLVTPTLARLAASDSAAIEATVTDQKHMELMATDSAKMTMKGVCQNIRLHVNDSANVDLRELIVSNASVKGSDGARAIVNARKALVVQTEDSAVVQYVTPVESVLPRSRESSRIDPLAPAVPPAPAVPAAPPAPPAGLEAEGE